MLAHGRAEMLRRQARMVLVAVVAAFLAAPALRAAEPACAPQAKQANLDFTLKDLNGKSVSLNDYKGKVILLDFWATWCAPCKVEIPGFIELYTKYRAQGLQVLGLAVDGPESALKSYASQMKMNYPVLLGEGREDIQEAFGPMIGLPTTVIIDRAGKICQSHSGLTPKKTFEDAIKALL